MTNTMIMATMADFRCTPEFVANLYRAGMRAVRINSAHVSPDTIRRMVRTIRSAAPDISILMDTKGAEIRTTDCREPVRFADGDVVRIVSGSHDMTTHDRICVTAEGLDDSIPEGVKIYLDDDAVELRTTGFSCGTLNAVVTRGGTLGARKTVNIRGVELPALPALTQRDEENIKAAMSEGIDMIAHSFVRSRADVEAVRNVIAGSDIVLYSKIECRPALENFDSILSSSDGLLVARGDLGAEIGIENVPIVEMKTIAACRKVGKPVIVATQMLQSMMNAPTPTRAEACDIAFAVMQGADTLLLCGETAQGEYPVECVETMAKIISAAENYKDGHECRY